MPDRPLRVLSIGAHPADIFDQSGGTMAHHAARGDYVASVVLTRGTRVHDAETHYLLPVTDYALKRARASDYEIMAVYSHRIKVD